MTTPADVTVKVDDMGNARSCVVAVEAMVKQICVASHRDPSEGLMMLLTAAAHTYQDYAKNPDDAGTLIEALVHANEAAKGWFGNNDNRPRRRKK